MDSVALGGHRWGGGSTGVCYLDLHSNQTFSLFVSDGASQQLGGCLRDFRNKPFPVRVRVEYYQQALTVSCQFYLCGVLQASPQSVLPVWSATSKPTVSFTCVECYKQALTVSSVSFTWVEYYRQTLTVKFCQFYLCGVLQASPQSVLPVWSATSKPTVSFTCVECYKQALTVSSVSFTWVEYYRQTLTVKFCQFYLCGVLQASPQSVLPVWSATSKPTVSFTCVECYKQALTVSSVSFTWVEYYRQTFTVKFCQFYLCGVLQASTL